MAPIRIGFIGLSTGSWGVNAHLPYLRSTSKYTIVGVLNSSKASAEASIKEHGLPASTKAYASADELAADPDIDLVVCSVRVDRHHDSVAAAIAAGKPVFCEWPLEKNLESAEKLNALRKKYGVKAFIGLQGREAWATNKIREIVKSGRIGKVLSVNVSAAASNMGATESEKLFYFNVASIGGNLLSIHFAHLIDFTLHGAADDIDTYAGLVSTQRPNTALIDKSGDVVKTMARETPDQIMVHGKLANSGAVFNVHLRGGPGFKDDPALFWRIYGEKGEIDVTSPMVFLPLASQDIAQIRVHDHASNTVETVSYEAASEFDSLPAFAQNVAREYERYAAGKVDELVGWDEAVRRHRLLHGIMESSDSGEWKKY